MKKISVLMATSFLDTLGFGLLMPQVPFLALRLEVEPWLIGWVLALYSIVQIACAPLWGRLSDARGRRPALLLGLAASFVAYLLFGFAISLPILLISRFVQGIGAGTGGVAQAYVGDVAHPGERAKAFGWLSAAASAGIMIGPALGSLATHLSPQAPGLVAAGFCLANLFFAWRWLPEPPPPSSDSASSTPKTTLRQMIASVFADHRSPRSRLIWIYAFGMLGFISMTSVLALYLDQRFGITEHNIGYFFLYTGALSVIVRALLLGPLFERFGEIRVMRLGAGVLATAFLLLPIPGTIMGLMLVLTLIPIGAACLFPATSALVSRLADATEQGQTLGVQQAFGGVSRVVAPLAATWIFQMLGGAIPFHVAGGTLLLTTALAFGLTTPAK